jgi:DNA polymerase III epsilon subunit-like protein
MMAQAARTAWPPLRARADRLLAEMVNTWFKRFSDRYQFPDSYTTLDLETSGFQPGVHLICTYGFTQVRGRKPVLTKEVVLNWPDFGAQYGVDLHKLSDDLERVRTAMEAKHQSFHHTWDYLRCGIDPGKALEQLLALIESAEERKEMLVTHNGWRFDIEFIRAHFNDYLKLRFGFEPDGVFDTGAMEKASQLADAANPLPAPGESLQTFSRRIGSVYAPGVFWALDRHCAGRYDLYAKSGLQPAQMHNAAADSLLLHHLFEAHRDLAAALDA